MTVTRGEQLPDAVPSQVTVLVMVVAAGQVQGRVPESGHDVGGRKREQALLSLGTRLAVPPHSGVAHAGNPLLAVGATLVSRTEEQSDDASTVRVGCQRVLFLSGSA